MTNTFPPGPCIERERALGFIKGWSGVQGQLRRPPPIGAAPSRRHSFAGLLLAWALFLPWVCCTNLDLCGVRMGPAEIGRSVALDGGKEGGGEGGTRGERRGAGEVQIQATQILSEEVVYQRVTLVF